MLYKDSAIVLQLVKSMDTGIRLPAAFTIRDQALVFKFGFNLGSDKGRMEGNSVSSQLEPRSPRKGDQHR